MPARGTTHASQTGRSVPGAASLAARWPAWVLHDGSEPAVHLYAPTSGALFARIASGLKRSFDGANLYAATEQGIWRFRLGPPASAHLAP